MSGLGKAVSLARHVGKEQAQDWLYRDATASFPPAQFSAWRAMCYADAILEYEHESNFARLLHTWETAFDRAIINAQDVADLGITRAVIDEDIWAGADFERPSFLLARNGEVVIVHPSPFKECPLTIIPRNGPPFCARHSDLRDISKVEISESGANVRDGGRNA